MLHKKNQATGGKGEKSLPRRGHLDTNLVSLLSKNREDVKTIQLSSKGNYKEPWQKGRNFFGEETFTPTKRPRGEFFSLGSIA